ncbi:MAG TPA: hypothetical protein PLG77_14940 [Burkholderiaceae bacterium]|nr:hypothetical protein [Burkholderiaceae bacterium]
MVWLDIAPQARHEQAGHRPALVLSPMAATRRAAWCLAARSPTGVVVVEMRAGLAARDIRPAQDAAAP